MNKSSLLLVLLGLSLFCLQPAIASSKRSCLFRSLDQRTNKVLLALRIDSVEALNNPPGWQQNRAHYEGKGESKQNILMLHDQARIKLLVNRGATPEQIDSLISDGALVLNRPDRLKYLIEHTTKKIELDRKLTAMNIHQQLTAYIKHQTNNVEKLVKLSQQRRNWLAQFAETQPASIEALKNINAISWENFLSIIDQLIIAQAQGKVMGVSDQLNSFMNEFQSQHFVSARNRMYEIVEAHRLYNESSILKKDKNNYLIMNIDDKILSVDNHISKNFDVIIVGKQAGKFELKYASDSKNIFNDSVSASNVRLWAEKIETYDNLPNKVTNISIYLDPNGKHSLLPKRFGFFIQEFQQSDFNEINVYNFDASFKFRLFKKDNKVQFEFGLNRKVISVQETSIENIFHLAFPEAPYSITLDELDRWLSTIQRLAA